MAPKIIFLFSLPRSGSTLVQRILASHDEITTTSETWILFPFLYGFKNHGIYAEYNHDLLYAALDDFCKKLPNGKDDYLEEIVKCTTRLYAKASGQKELYFLDKTPRYHLIVNDIIPMFPEAKFIFLWRNPLSIIASIVNTWLGGKWNISNYRVDLFKGLPNLVSAYQNYSNRVCAMRFEDFVSDPETECRKIFDYLDLSFDSKTLKQFSKIQLSGLMGDPTRIKQYDTISKQPLEKWPRTFANPIRKKWGKNYLRCIGEKRLKVMGYDFERLINQLHAIPSSYEYFTSDLFSLSKMALKKNLFRYNKRIKNILFFGKSKSMCSDKTFWSELFM